MSSGKDSEFDGDETPEKPRTLWVKWPHTEPRRNYDEASDEEILAQPCVVAALLDAYARGGRDAAESMEKDILQHSVVREALQRVHDLVRHQRGALHDADLITNEEYAALAGDHGAVARLEGYDAATRSAYQKGYSAGNKAGWERGFADASEGTDE